MKEQDIAEAVSAVLKQMNGHQHGEHQSCSCQAQKITLKIANALIERVKKKAGETGLKVVVAVADQSARPVAVQCMDGAYIASFDIALNKTFTAVGLQMSTAELSKLSQPEGPLYGIQNTNQGRVVVFGGGEPLTINGIIVGALGVSGGTTSQDTALAAYGKEIFEEVVSCL